MQTKYATFSNDNQQNLFDEIICSQAHGEIKLDTEIVEHLENCLKCDGTMVSKEFSQEKPNPELANYGNGFHVLVTGESYFEDNGMQGFHSESRSVAVYQDKILIVYETGEWQDVHTTSTGDYKECGDTFCKIISVIAAPTEQQIQQAVHETQEIIRKKTM